MERTTHAVEGIERSTAFVSLTAARLTEIASSPTLQPADRAAANEAAARLREAEDASKAVAKAKADAAVVEKDVERLRESMKALAGGAAGGGGANPFAARVLAGEDKLEALRKKREDLEGAEKAKRQAAEGALMGLGK